jgi:hypothetical protein
VAAADRVFCVLSAKQPLVALDPATGEVKQRRPYKKNYQRCYPDTNTVRYFISGDGDFIDVRTGKVRAARYRGYRGTCRVGFLPANGC